MIEYVDVHKAFDVPVLAGIDLVIEDGETLSVVGPSGTGKSVLLKTTIGLILPDRGDVRIDGESVVSASAEKLEQIRRKVRYVFQYAALFDSMNVVENIAFPLIERYRLSRDEIMERVRDLLRRLDLADVAGIEQKFPPELSGGQRKRVGLARALMLEPQILIYDEPTSGLDPITSRMVDDLIDETRERFDVTSVVISHDMTSTFRIAHQAFLLVKGEVIASGKPDELAYGDNEDARAFILASGVAPDRIGRVEGAAEEGDTKIKYKAM